MPDLPTPVPDEVTQPYWDAAAAERLAIQRCSSCGRFQHPPESACVRCTSTAVTFEEVSGRGTLYSFAVARQAFDPAFLDRLPYLLGLVELDDAPGVRLLTNVVTDDPDALAIGTPVEVFFEQRGGWKLPMFRPVAEVTA